MKTFELQLIFGNNCHTEFSHRRPHAILHAVFVNNGNGGIEYVFV